MRAAAVVAVANTIILRALQEHLPFDDDVATAAARDELARLEAEQREGVARLKTLRRRTHRSYGQSRHQFDYRVDDIDALRLREATHKELAARIAQSAADDGFVATLVAAARARAWDDVGSTVVDRLRWAASPLPDYDEGATSASARSSTRTSPRCSAPRATSGRRPRRADPPGRR